MRLLVVLVLIATSAHGGTVWEDGGFKLEEAGWSSQDFLNRTGVKCGLTLPDNGWFLIEGEGALELYFPESGKWKLDQGIIIFDGCMPTMVGSRNTIGGACGINAEFRCEDKGNRVLLLVYVSQMFPTRENRPTMARWVKGRSQYGQD